MLGDFTRDGSTHTGRHRKSGGMTSTIPAAVRQGCAHVAPRHLKVSAWAPTLGFAVLGTLTVTGVTMVGLTPLGAGPPVPQHTPPASAGGLTVVETPAAAGGDRVDSLTAAPAAVQVRHPASTGLPALRVTVPASATARVPALAPTSVSPVQVPAARRDSKGSVGKHRKKRAGSATPSPTTSPAPVPVAVSVPLPVPVKVPVVTALGDGVSSLLGTL
jgi:hypothetical protein